jgi:hypothetical protein
MWNPERFESQHSMQSEEDLKLFDEMFYRIGSTEGLDDKR